MAVGLKLLRRVRTVLEVFAFMAIIFMLVVFSLTAGILQVPDVAELGMDSALVKYGVRMLLLGIFFVGCGLIGLLFLMARFTRLYIFPVKITPQNIKIQYVIAKLMLTVNQFLCAIYTSLLMIGVYRAEIAIPSLDFAVMTTAGLAIFAVIMALYYFGAWRNK